MKDQEQRAREQLGRDIRDAHLRACKSSDQRATQDVFVALGLHPDALSSGEFAAVGMLVGGTYGSLIDHGSDISELERVALGERMSLAELIMSASRREQVHMFLDFIDQQLERLCQPGTARVVLATLVRMLGKTFTAIDSEQSAS